ncbi:hypothetical protein CSUI_005759, partial [Cystoisospora suis]
MSLDCLVEILRFHGLFRVLGIHPLMSAWKALLRKQKKEKEKFTLSQITRALYSLSSLPSDLSPSLLPADLPRVQDHLGGFYRCESDQEEKRDNSLPPSSSPSMASFFASVCTSLDLLSTTKSSSSSWAKSLYNPHSSSSSSPELLSSLLLQGKKNLKKSNSLGDLPSSSSSPSLLSSFLLLRMIVSHSLQTQAATILRYHVSTSPHDQEDPAKQRELLLLPGRIVKLLHALLRLSSQSTSDLHPSMTFLDDDFSSRVHAATTVDFSERNEPNLLPSNKSSLPFHEKKKEEEEELACRKLSIMPFVSPVLLQALREVTQTLSLSWILAEGQVKNVPHILGACVHLLLLEIKKKKKTREYNASQRRKTSSFHTFNTTALAETPSHIERLHPSSLSSSSSVFDRTGERKIFLHEMHRQQDAGDIPRQDKDKDKEEEERKNHYLSSSSLEKNPLCPFIGDSSEILFIHLQQLTENLISLCFDLSFIRSSPSLSARNTLATDWKEEKKRETYRVCAEKVSTMDDRERKRRNGREEEEEEKKKEIPNSSRKSNRILQPSFTDRLPSSSSSSFLPPHCFKEDISQEKDHKRNEREEGRKSSTFSSSFQPSFSTEIFSLRQVQLFCRVLTLYRLIPLLLLHPSSSSPSSSSFSPSSSSISLRKQDSSLSSSSSSSPSLRFLSLSSLTPSPYLTLQGSSVCLSSLNERKEETYLSTEDEEEEKEKSRAVRRKGEKEAPPDTRISPLLKSLENRVNEVLQIASSGCHAQGFLFTSSTPSTSASSSFSSSSSFPISAYNRREVSNEEGPPIDLSSTLQYHPDVTGASHPPSSSSPSPSSSSPSSSFSSLSEKSLLKNDSSLVSTQQEKKEEGEKEKGEKDLLLSTSSSSSLTPEISEQDMTKIVESSSSSLAPVDGREEEEELTRRRRRICTKEEAEEEEEGRECLSVEKLLEAHRDGLEKDVLQVAYSRSLPSLYLTLREVSSRTSVTQAPPNQRREKEEGGGEEEDLLPNQQTSPSSSVTGRKEKKESDGERAMKRGEGELVFHGRKSKRPRIIKGRRREEEEELSPLPPLKEEDFLFCQGDKRDNSLEKLHVNFHASSPSSSRLGRLLQETCLSFPHLLSLLQAILSLQLRRLLSGFSLSSSSSSLRHSSSLSSDMPSLEEREIEEKLCLLLLTCLVSSRKGQAPMTEEVSNSDIYAKLSLVTNALEYLQPRLHALFSPFLISHLKV